jgi:hypothetical protein
LKNATIEFLCGDCDRTTSFKQDISLGDNTADFICRGCGEHWHVLFEVTRLEPLHIGTSMLKCEIGVLRNGTFFEKGQLH